MRHENILTVYDWGEDGGSPFLVMELLTGGSLRSMMDKGSLLSPAQAAEVGVAASRALDYAHRRGLVHRDIKPANLIFDGEGRVRVADFGLARALAEATWTEPAGAVVGTARYAAPEQAKGATWTAKPTCTRWRWCWWRRRPGPSRSPPIPPSALSWPV